METSQGRVKVCVWGRRRRTTVLLTAHQVITMKRFYKENHQFVARIDGGNGGNQSHGNGWVMDH